MFLSHITDKIRHDLGTGQRYLHNATEPIRETFYDIPVDVAKGLNRGTPWGQANQRNFNAANVPYIPLQANALHVQQPNRRAVGQTFNDATVMPNMQGQGYSAVQSAPGIYNAPANGLQRQEPYSQQQPYQQGVTAWNIPSPIAAAPQVDWSKYYQQPLQQIY